MRRKVNFIPKNRRATINLPVDQMLLVGAALSVIFCLIMGFTQLSEKKQVQATYAGLLKKEQQLNQQLALLETVSSSDKQKAARQKLIQSITGNQLPWSDMFKELSLLVPSNAWLTDLILQNQGGNLAVAMKGETISQSKMAQFFTVLESSDYYRGVLVEYSEALTGYAPQLFGFVFSSPNITPTFATDKKEEKSE